MRVWLLPGLLLLCASAKVCGVRCASSLGEIGHPVTKAQISEPIEYFATYQTCPRNFNLLFATENLTVREKTLCEVDALVPMDIPLANSVLHNETYERMMALKDDDSADEPGTSMDMAQGIAVGVAALNLSTGRWHLVDDHHKFECVLCQFVDVELQLPSAELADAVTSTYSRCDQFQVNVTSIEARTSAKVPAEEMLSIRTALTHLLQPITLFQSKMEKVPKAIRRYLEGGKLRLEFQLLVSIPMSFAESSEPASILGKYLVTVEDRSFCPREETIDAAGEVAVWPRTNGLLLVEGTKFQIARNSSSRRILRRNCYFDDTNYQALWSDVSFWQLEWRECSDDEAFVSEQIYKEFLDEETLYRHNHQLERFAFAPITSTELNTVTHIVNRRVDLTNNMDAATSRDLVNITASLVLADGEDFCLAQDTRVYVLVAALEGPTPVLGFTVEYEDSTDAGNLNITLDRTSTKEPRRHQQFFLAVSDGLVSAHKRLMAFVFWMDTPMTGMELRTEQRTKQYTEMTVALVLTSRQKDGALNYGWYSDYFVDLTFKPHYDTNNLFKTVTRCSAWNDQLGGWVTEGCHPLKAARGNLTVCRCSAKYFSLTDVPGVATARYALNKAYESRPISAFVAFIGDNTALLAATVVECLLSAVGLCSIVATAVLFKAWRQNTGHQILLHMVFALTCNLVLGFVTSFVHLDTESVGCVALGVIRHYSFLAMFLWMFVLSGLQWKRLMTVAGAKAVTHLILKASAFAWGVPVLPIVILLAWNIRFYQSDSADRGYCYPEGLVFQLTIQAPAGVILFVNLLIFIAIVMNIFECGGGEEITRHSKNENAEQLNKLKTSLFIFFLFGFTWVFHFLSELRVIDSEFLFQYLFLMTATTHVTVLALFFVVLQEGTRKEWLGLLGTLRCGSKTVSVTPVEAARSAYQPQLPKGIANRVKQAKAAADAV